MKDEREKFLNLLDNYPVVDKEKKEEKKSVKIIDLHLHTKLEAEEKIDMILKSSTKENLKKIIIICGKGIHSHDGPVIFKHIKEFLVRNKRKYKKIKTDKNNNIYVYF